MATAGICAGYFTCYGTIHIASSISWRLPFILAAIMAVGLAISCVYLPVSPRWLLLHDRRDDALRESQRLNLARAEVEKDILTTAKRDQSKVSIWQGLSIVFHRQYRVKTALGLFILGMIQLCGIDGILYVCRVPTLEINMCSHPNNLVYVCSTHQYFSLRPVFRMERPRFWHQGYLQSLC